MRWCGAAILMLGLFIAGYGGLMGWELQQLRLSPQPIEAEAHFWHPRSVLQGLLELLGAPDAGGRADPGGLAFRASAVIYSGIALGLLIAAGGTTMVFRRNRR